MQNQYVFIFFIIVIYSNIHTKLTLSLIISLDTDTMAAEIEPLQFTILQYRVDTQVDALHELIFTQHSEFIQAFYQEKKFSEINIGEWAEAEGGSRQRTVTYVMPKTLVLPRGHATQTQTCIVSNPGSMYVIDLITSVPEMPYGESYNTQVRFQLSGDGEQSILQISFCLNFLRNVVGKKMMRSRSKDMMKENYELFMRVLQRFVSAEGQVSVG